MRARAGPRQMFTPKDERLNRSDKCSAGRRERTQKEDTPKGGVVRGMAVSGASTHETNGD